MGDVNCLRCKYRHTDNGNCTAVGGFCTAVPAAHCPLLREYLDTELTPEEVISMKFEWCAMMDALNSIGGGYEDTNREPAEVRKLEREYRTAVNELCYMCGKYKQEHEGACRGCRWKKPV